MADDNVKNIQEGKKDDEVDVRVLSPPVLAAAIELIDENVNGKAARAVANALEQSPALKLPASMLTQKQE